MSPFIARIQALLPHIPSQQEMDQAFLNEAVTPQDLERRQWEIDHRNMPVASQVGGLGGALH